VVGYLVWTAANLLILIAYLRFFGARVMGTTWRKRLLVLMLMAYPVFLNFLYGQVNIWLTIFVGEFMRAAMGGRPFRSGLWLAGLLIKPQYLALVVIMLLMQKSIRALAGLAMMSAVLLGISYALLGGAGVLSLVKLWLGFAGGLPATGPNVMMNWRAVGLYLVTILDPAVAWALTALAMLLTAVLGLYSWRRRIEANSPLFAVALLGTLAATAGFAWHSHVSSAAILICPLLLLVHRAPRLPRYALEAWVLAPPALHLAAIILADAAGSGVVSGTVPALANLLSAIGPFAFNLYFLIWATRCVEGSADATRKAAPA